MSASPLASNASLHAEFRSLAALREAALSEYERENFSPCDGWRSLRLAAALLEQVAESPDQDRIVEWLSTLSCPVIGIGSGVAGRLLEWCDLAVPSEAPTVAILGNIDRAPLAAMVLVQVLRVTQRLSPADGLTLESLAYATLQAGPEHKAWLRGRPSVLQAQPTNEPAALVARSGDRLEIRLNRPGNRNALTIELRDALCEALQLLISDPTIESALISGEGRCFSIGGALEEFGTAPDPATAHAVRSVRMPARLLSRCGDRVEFRLHGACIGAGMELAAFGKRVVAARNSFFQLPELRLGLIPGAGGCVSIPRRIGRHRTAYLALSGRRLSAAKALEWGLVDALVD